MQGATPPAPGPPPDASGLIRLVDALSVLGEGGLVLDGAKLLHANEAYLGMVGYTLAELQALPSMLSLIAPEELPRVKQRYLERGMTVPIHERYETVLVAKGGRRIPVMLSSVHVRDVPGTLVMSFA